MKKQAPYVTSTGIQIGIGYIQRPPKPMPIDDKDMLYLQEALLATPEYIKSKHLYNTTVAFSMFFGLALMFLILLSS
jgi:hypothetical protein